MGKEGASQVRAVLKFRRISFEALGDSRTHVLSIGVWGGGCQDVFGIMLAALAWLHSEWQV